MRIMKEKKTAVIIMAMAAILFIAACVLTYYGKNLFAVSASGDGAFGESVEIGTGKATGSEQEPLPTWEPSGDYIEIDRLMLVNKQHPLGKEFVPGDLIRSQYVAANRSADGQYMTREATDAFNKLASDALAAGHEIVVTTAYRSYNFQSYLYNSYVEKDGQALADTYSAQPGKSEHQTGLVADVSSPSVDYELTAAYGDTAEGKWLAKNSWKYGFIIRYPLGKEDITGYTYEPWHLRYVGQDAAKAIKKANLTLEEYLQQNT